MPFGLYESLLTDGLTSKLVIRAAHAVPATDKVADAEAPEFLARFIAHAARRALTGIDPGDRVALVNRVLAELQSDESFEPGELRQLLQLSAPGPVTKPTVRPSTALSDSALLTNARDEPSLGAELRAELASADEVDLLCAFVRWHGIRVLEDALIELHERKIPFRVITTTYVGATERKALDKLVAKYGAEVQVNYETQSTRLHAKAWLFRRKSGFNTAYVGSSNLSHSALVDGLEWNVRLSQISTPALIHKFSATFDSYWNDPSFEDYDPERDSDRLDKALGRSANYGGGDTLDLSGIEVRPYPYQQTMLESLEAERNVHGHHRNLIIAATGTGKTIVAGLDYQNLLRAHGSDLKILFVAHRMEILQQSQRVFRQILMDGNFGELFVGGEKPERWNHVFASVQSLNSYGVDRIDPQHFDVVVIDEFHHAEAKTYRRLLDHLKPKELLGLTATPERADGVDVKNDFFAGRAAAELRLWDALEADILVPFHYFGISDDVDLTSVEWKRGSYTDAGLDAVYTGNDARTAKILVSLADKVTDVHDMRAIGFCVSVAHTAYMSRMFNAAGIKSTFVTGATPRPEREESLRQLRSGEISCIFAVDVFNEGLDIPVVDTILMLRPTQSATIFLQQLGRGLRRAHGKAVLTVLDYIGQHRREYRLDTRYRALTGFGRSRLRREVAAGFPFLPSGSQLVLDRVARKVVLESISSQLKFKKDVVADIRSHAATRPSAQEYLLAEYLEDAERGIREIYSKWTWTDLSREAGLSGPNGEDVVRSAGEDQLLKRMAALVHVDDPERADAYTRLTRLECPDYSELSVRDQRYARMLVFTLWPSGNKFGSYQAALVQLRGTPAVCSEIRQIVALSADVSRRVPLSLGKGLDDVPIFSHASYRREEILAALGYADLEKGGSVGNHQAGVAWCSETSTDALLVTLHKSEKEFSPNTMYRDYALNASRFHWETQNATTVASATGSRYIKGMAGGSHVVLFTRHSNNDDEGILGTYTCLGPVDYKRHEGEKPIAITWDLQREMPADVYVSASAVPR
ncbi:DUF3427 domain-containing protein [Cryobacterium frigoriphilum]|uniref:DUF3427 domain-containing protein n=1 Tax=Cryobacterium frigoriphilum TaxID=1259150 RepID=A0A4R9A274_9MICO|nr:DUF3427 domain-containing protein [Cryobacterium frigoriphilum]TFD50303.1 DUF3427 domain-containing protein [Cryobacterium frigoriphilum]